jgi:alkylhydroperoxidase family enzyme
MKPALLLIGMAILVMLSRQSGASEPSNEPKPIPATRPELKTALNALVDRQPRIPLPPAAAGEASHDGYLPKSWGRGGGLDYLAQIVSRGTGVLSGNGLADRLDYLFTDCSFWIVSRANNCHYCLGHQELKLRAAGLDDDTIAALDSDWSRFDPRQQAVLAFTRKLTLEPDLVVEADIAALKSELSEPQIIELVFAIALFNSVNRWTDSIGLPQEHHFRGDRELTMSSPTSTRFQHRKSIVVGIARAERQSLTTIADAQQAIAAIRNRKPYVALSPRDDERRLLEGMLGDREPFEWERALSRVEVSGKVHVERWSRILSDNNLSLRLKAELALISAVHNRAWYAAGHAAGRLTALDVSPEDLMLPLSSNDNGETTGAVAAAHRLAAKLTADPHLITDADIASVREHYSDAETAQIVQVICMANLFDRFTIALGLPLEAEIAREKLPQR